MFSIIALSLFSVVSAGTPCHESQNVFKGNPRDTINVTITQKNDRQPIYRMFETGKDCRMIKIWGEFGEWGTKDSGKVKITTQGCLWARSNSLGQADWQCGPTAKRDKVFSVYVGDENYPLAITNFTVSMNYWGNDLELGDIKYRFLSRCESEKVSQGPKNPSDRRFELTYNIAAPESNFESEIFLWDEKCYSIRMDVLYINDGVSSSNMVSCSWVGDTLTYGAPDFSVDQLWDCDYKPWELALPPENTGEIRISSNFWGDGVKVEAI